MTNLSKCLVTMGTVLNLLSPALPGTARAQGAKLIEGAKKEETLVFWNPDAAKLVESALAKFKERYPFIKTEYWRARRRRTAPENPGGG